MNSLSPRGHVALWKKHARNDMLPAASVKAEIPYSSPPQAMNKYQSPCSPFSPCAKISELLVDTAHQDTPKSIEIEASEEQDESSPPPAITLEECLEEKANIDRVLDERARLGPFLIESTERPTINNQTEFIESVEAIRLKVHGDTKSHLYDDVAKIKDEYRAYGLNHIDVIAIRLYTTAVAYVVNEALRNYSLYHMPIPDKFLPYIYALLNALAKIDSDRIINEANGYESEPVDVARYIPVLDDNQRAAIQSILDAHQPGAYVMYPAFTSTSWRDLAKRLWLYDFECKFEIKAKTAVSIQDFSINWNEHEYVFPPGAMFHLLERNGLYFVMEEVTLQALRRRRDELPC